MKHLSIGTTKTGDKPFKLPLDMVTSTQAILAKRRVGKSYTAAVQAEEMLEAGQQTVIIDPTGAHWGLRSSADGKTAGYQIALFGGEHNPDVPLDETAGEIIAQAIVSERFSAILDLSLLRKGQLNRFMAIFLETLYHKNREAMHLFVDEADAIAPQKPFGDEARALGAMQDVVRRGGIRGIGCTLITQRPAVINKDVLTQCEILTTMRIVHHRDIEAINAWVSVHGDETKARDMIASLPSLPVGEAWFWAPAMNDLFERIQVRHRTTFDSGATPKPGESIRPPKVFHKADAERLGKAISDTVEKAKANDPAILRRQIADLKRQLEQRPSVAPEVKTVEKRIHTEKDLKRLEAVGKTFAKAAEGLGSMVSKFLDAVNAAKEATMAAQSLTATPGDAATCGEGSFYGGQVYAPGLDQPRTFMLNEHHTSHAPKRAPRARKEAQSADSIAAGINKTQQRVLDAIVWFEIIGIDNPRKAQVGMLAGIDHTGGYFSNTIGPLSTGGYILCSGGHMSLTAAGRELTQAPEFGTTLKDYHAAIRAVLQKRSGMSAKIFDAIIAGARLSAEIGEAAGIDHTGGYFSNCIGPLGTLGLIERGGGSVTPTEIMFPKGLS